MTDSRWQRWLLDTASSTEQSRLMDVNQVHRWFVWSLIVFVFSVISWASLTQLDEVVSGSGRIIPLSKVHVVQSLDGGILKFIQVREGDHVRLGETLLQVDETRYLSNLMVNETELKSVSGEIARLESEMDFLAHRNEDNHWSIEDQQVRFSDSFISEHPGLVKEQQSLFEKKLASFLNQQSILEKQLKQKEQELIEHQQKIDTISRSVKLIRDELRLKTPLAAEGIVTKIDILNLERKENELRGELKNAQLSETRLHTALAEFNYRYRDLAIRYHSDVQKDLQVSRERFTKLTEGQIGLQDRVEKTTVTAPVEGLVKVVHINTPGSVVQPGTDLVEIVPSADNLVLEARIQPADIAFLRPGQSAQVKLTAYEFASYGGVKGEVSTISADTLDDERGQAYYRVKILIPQEDENLPLLPGMMAVVDILTGQRTVLNYILSPVFKAIQ